MDDNKYVPLTIESDGTDPIKYYSTSAAAKHCGITKQTLDYAHRNQGRIQPKILPVLRVCLKN